MTSLVQQHDCLLLDLDGTVFRGDSPTAGAIDALADRTIRALFVTNNASRSAAKVAEHLCGLGFSAASDDVVTSAQSAARLLAEQLPAGAPILVLGTDALAGEIRAVGLAPVRLFSDSPVAVVQGHSPSTGWADLCEAALAIREGALWVATNTDRTLPSERGLVPGNGSMVAALSAATGLEPVVAGKPAPTLVRSALARGHFRAPLVVGDRLDTDIAGANAAGLPSLLVLSGVTTASNVVHAMTAERPTYVARNLCGLHEPADSAAVAAHPAWRAEVHKSTVTITSTGADPGTDCLSVVRATARAVWDEAAHPEAVRICAGDDAAHVALHRWSLIDDVADRRNE
jgi:glycerol 3-phosphatase-2